MTYLLFPDNTVLVNFGHISQISLLGELVRGRGRWTASVAEECARSSRVPGLADLSAVAGHLGEPLRPESIDEYLATDEIRLLLSRPGERRDRNLGEAETLAIITRRFAGGAVFVSDDRAALARAESLEVPTCTTAALLILAVRSNRLDLDDGWNGVVRLRSMARAVPRCPANYFEFASVCQSDAAA